MHTLSQKLCSYDSQAIVLQLVLIQGVVNVVRYLVWGIDQTELHIIIVRA